MHEVVHSNFHIRRLKSLRLPSFAGNGLPERMRSTAFAFLGLTAALGLALVAIFAQLSFPVLSPAPPPAGPAGQSGVSSSLALGRARNRRTASRRSSALRRPRAAAETGGRRFPPSREWSGRPRRIADPRRGARQGGQTE